MRVAMASGTQDTKATGSHESGAGRLGSGVGIWIGCFGWLIGFLVVAYDALDVLWPELLGGALLTTALAWALARRAPRQLQASTWMPLLLAAIGVLVLYYALVVEPALLRVPHVVDRMRRLGSVVTVPWWVGAAVLARTICHRGKWRLQSLRSG